MMVLIYSTSVIRCHPMIIEKRSSNLSSIFITIHMIIYNEINNFEKLNH